MLASGFGTNQHMYKEQHTLPPFGRTLQYILIRILLYTSSIISPFVSQALQMEIDIFIVDTR